MCPWMIIVGIKKPLRKRVPDSEILYSFHELT
jgi:hypothetical protein